MFIVFLRIYVNYRKLFERIYLKIPEILWNYQSFEDVYTIFIYNRLCHVLCIKFVNIFISICLVILYLLNIASLSYKPQRWTIFSDLYSYHDSIDFVSLTYIFFKEIFVMLDILLWNAINLHLAAIFQFTKYFIEFEKLVRLWFVYLNDFL